MTPELKAALTMVRRTALALIHAIDKILPELKGSKPYIAE